MSVLELKRKYYRALATLAETSPQDIAGSLEQISHSEAIWRVAHPINEIIGSEAAIRELWAPLKDAMPDMERRDLIFVGGTYEERTYLAAIGHYCGTFLRDWLSIPANSQAMNLRYGEVFQIEDGKIIQANLLWDVLDFIRQAGFWPLAPSLGAEGLWLGPRTGDGLVLGESDAALSDRSLHQTLAMHRTLFEYDNCVPSRDGLLGMDQRHHWHPKMMWYGPSGIGTARGLAGFVDYHQLPFRLAFQRPQGSEDEVAAARARHSAGHYIRIGDGDYSVTGGWPSVCAVHYGGDFAGIPATGKDVTMRVMDFYHHHEGLIRENWVPLDMLDLLNQMGFDVMSRLQGQFLRGIT
ncbi:MAG: ester cyclase [Stappiaceae bacterium]